MTDPDESAHRRRTRAAGSDMAVREPEEVDDGDEVFEVRLPIASLGEVRNEGDDPLTRAELDGMARQLDSREIGVFPGHGGDSLVSGGRYSQFEKLGVWTNASVEERDGADMLVATARMPDPETLPAATDEYRQALAILKEQALRGIPMDASIGWREDEDYPGGVDLMEASIVGIGADPRTNTGDESAEVVARAAVEAGADPDTLVSAVRRAITRNIDDPAYSEGDAVSWDWQGDTVHGRVADEPAESVTVSGNTITGEDGEAVYAIHEWDEEVEGFRRENVAKPESSLSESQMDMPSATEENFQDMTDTDPGEEPDTTDEQDASDGDAETHDHIRQSASEIADVAEDIMMGHVEAAMDDIESELADMMGEDEAAMDGDEEEDDKDDESEQSADDPESVDGDDDTVDRDVVREVADLRAELDEVRDRALTGDDVETPETETADTESSQDADIDEDRDATDDADAATAGPNWRSD